MERGSEMSKKIIVTIKKELDDLWLSQEDIEELSKGGTLREAIIELLEEDIWEFYSEAELTVEVVSE